MTDKQKDRAQYVKDRVNDAKNKRREVLRLADELFLHESTIYRDLEK